MDYKLKVTSEGDCEVILPAGSDFVRTLYPESKVNAIIAASNGKIEKSDFDGFEICVNDGEYYFAGTITAGKLSKAEAEPKKAAGKGKAKAKSE